MASSPSPIWKKNTLRESPQSVENLFPIEYIESQKALSKNGSISLGFECTRLPVYDLVSSHTYQGMHFALCSAAKSLPAGAFIHKMDVFYETPYLAPIQPQEYFHKKRLAHVQFRPVLKQRSYLFLSFSSPLGPFHAGQTFFSLGKKRSAQPLENLEEKFQLAEKASHQFLANLLQIEGLELKRLNDDELEAYYYQYLNLTFSTRVPTLTHHMANERTGCRIGENVLNIISLVGQGTEVSTSVESVKNVAVPFLQPLLLDLPFPHMVHQCLEICDTEKELRNLDRMRTMIQAFSAGNDQAGTIHESGLRELSHEIRQNGESLSKFYCSIMVYDCDPAEQRRKIETVLASFASMNGMKAAVENIDTCNLFFSMIGGNVQENFRWILMPLRNACCYFHFTGPSLGDAQGHQFCTRDGDPILINFWNESLDNKNKIIIGPSGSGKSFAVNTFITQHYADHEEVVILDVGGSYKGLFQLIKGKYIEYRTVEGLRFNPFLLPKTDGVAAEISQEKLNFLVTLLILLWKGNDYLMSKTEKAILARLVLAYYRSFQGDSGFCQLLGNASENSPVHPAMDSFYQFIHAVGHSEKAQETLNIPPGYLDLVSLGIVLHDYSLGGPYKNLLNAPESILLSDHPLICFDLQGIKEDLTLFPVVSLMIIELVLDKLREGPTLRKHIYMDEAWSMLKDALGEFVMSMFRTIRKSNGAVTIITQGIDEIEKSPVGLAILQNAATKIILDHRSASQFYPALQLALGLTEYELILLKSLRKNEGEGWRELFVKFGNSAIIFRLDPSPEEKIAFDSRAESRKRMQEMIERYEPNLALAIDQLLEEDSSQ